MSYGVVIIGTGQGGFQLAASLRQEGYQSPITMVGDEDCLPYQRPPLSKAYLKDGRLDAIQLRPASFYERNSIDIVVPERVTVINRASRTVETLTGRTLPYEHLVLATGARSFIPPIPGLEAAKVHSLKTTADANDLRDALTTSRKIIVIGGGFIGLEFAAVAISLGHQVTVVEAASRLMARVVSEPMSETFRVFHEQMGSELVLGASVVEVAVGHDGLARGVRLSDGRSIEGDMILVAAGVRPNTELAAAAGLQVANGIVVNSSLMTADPSISALGDCAAFPCPSSGGMIRLESVQAATDHARTIARRIVGKSVTYDALPWFWSDQGTLKLQIAGLGQAADEDVAVVRPEGRQLVFRFKMGQLLSVETINAAGEHMAARQLLRHPSGVSLDALEARDFDIVGLAKALKEPG
ncbi:NAD(P)/FAD-dependent oxidoreductase [Pseudorhizobium pelagicum]|uniref:Pyridine nucleotide-disulfide oxidoreductase n=1 Tax=Pseudorhizobium pelagicum TaxID=1509405 RepID=A0A922NWC7_9HYPH|nr:FAD-dependent oxidoreductase [Pseudorhizobium pelagicum]KEQ02787.1 pyridine nucleotide-disulfide oxidoreductase [Pseudorhizobium pelagicum]KEQ02803.1 pyridine nucleotide-disulfide oxidoreductase [Pseudorhizobium pelagicum]